MTNVTLGGTPCHTNGTLPAIGSAAPSFTLRKVDLSKVQLSDYQGSKLILNIFPSVDTGTCATSVRTFNQKASSLPGTKVLCISKDLPFAQKRFCGAEGIENVETLSDFADGAFGRDYGIELQNGPFENIHARAIVVVSESGKVLHTEIVEEIADEPNYDAAIAALK